MKSRKKSILRKPRKSKLVKSKVYKKSTKRRNSKRRNSKRRNSKRRNSKMNMPNVFKKAAVLTSLENTANTDCFNGYPEMYYKRLDYYIPLLGVKKADEVYHNCIEKAFSNPKFTQEDKKNILRKVYKQRYPINRTDKEYDEFIKSEYDFYRNVLPLLKNI